jgi:hypothetical protein
LDLAPMRRAAMPWLLVTRCGVWDRWLPWQEERRQDVIHPEGRHFLLKDMN